MHSVTRSLFVSICLSLATLASLSQSPKQVARDCEPFVWDERCSDLLPRDPFLFAAAISQEAPPQDAKGVPESTKPGTAQEKKITQTASADNSSRGALKTVLSDEWPVTSATGFEPLQTVTQTAGVDNTRMGAYRALAQLTMEPFRNGDAAKAAELARILERTWDQGDWLNTCENSYCKSNHSVSGD